MKVYVLILWFYEGDSYLIDAFEGVFSSYEKALEKKNEIAGHEKEVVTSEEANRRYYESDGGYGSPTYYEIRECVV